jgi:hypothetical protein
MGSTVSTATSVAITDCSDGRNITMMTDEAADRRSQAAGRYGRYLPARDWWGGRNLEVTEKLGPGTEVALFEGCRRAKSNDQNEQSSLVVLILLVKLKY